MQLLGTYNSTLASFQYQELLALLQAALSQGDLSSGSAFDKATLKQLEAQATSFASLPTATAGSRALDESVLQPAALLRARFTALLAETNSFMARSEALISFLMAETDLLDRLLAADRLQNWISTLPHISAGWSSAWDFLTGQGKTSVLIPPVDPTNSVKYTSELNIGSVFNVSTGSISSGLLPPAAIKNVGVKNLSWTYPESVQADALYGPDMSWTELTLVDDLPAVTFSSDPQVDVMLPLVGATTNFIFVTGNVPGGALPTYLRLLFYPRTSEITGTVSDSTLFTLSQYSIDPDSVVAYTKSVDGATTGFFTAGTDFTVDQSGSITPVNIGTDVAVTFRFSENFPAYQCSVDQQSWSDIHMLDVNRPFRDNETLFYPLDIVDGAFPLTDEAGMPTGLYFKLTAPLPTDYTLRITTPAASAHGPRCVLTVDLAQSSYCNTLSIKPFSAFPAKLKSVELLGLAQATSNVVFAGDVLVDKVMDIRFDRQLVTRVILTFVQENYTITEYQDLSVNSLRRATMSTVEASLPFSLGDYHPPVTTTRRGYQYAIGLEEVTAKDVVANLPGVLVQGPLAVDGCPVAVRFDAETLGTCDTLLCYEAFNSAGVLVDSNTSGVALTPGTPKVIPYTGGTDLSHIASARLSLKFVLRDATSVVTRYNLQASLR